MIFVFVRHISLSKIPARFIHVAAKWQDFLVNDAAVNMGACISEYIFLS